MNPEILKLQSQLGKIQQKLYKLREKCPHEDCVAEYGSNTGGYDGPDFDLYWIDVTCNDCNKWMRFFSQENPEEYRHYDKFVKKKQ